MGSLGMSDGGWDGGRLEETHVRTTAESLVLFTEPRCCREISG